MVVEEEALAEEEEEGEEAEEEAEIVVEATENPGDLNESREEETEFPNPIKYVLRSTGKRRKKKC